MARKTILYCDKCNASLEFLNHTTKNITSIMARKKGWSIGEKDLCPNCRQYSKAKGLIEL